MAIERADVVCPFYRYDDGYHRLVCEGLTDDSSVIQQYKAKKSHQKYMEYFCYGNCTGCAVFRMIVDAKYAEEGV